MRSPSRSRRSRAPSPEPQRSPASDLFAKVAQGVLEYSIHHYLTRQTSSSAGGIKSSPPPPDQSAKEMPPSKRRSSGSDETGARGSRRDDPTHELISHLLRGAAALAVRHFLSKRGKKKEKDKNKEKGKAKVASHRDEFVGAPVPEPRRHHHRHRHRRRPHRHEEGPKTELMVALDSLSAELARTSAQIRRMAGARRPHRHRDGRCDVYEGLVACAGRLEAETERVRTGVNNIRNLAGGQLSGLPGERSGRERNAGDEERRREGSWVRTRPVPEGGAGSYPRPEAAEKRSGSYVRTREVPKEKEGETERRKARAREYEDRGRKRTRSR